MIQLEFPQVSIIMPVRNESAFIEMSLGSIFLQDYPSQLLEILIVDGMSTDDTKEKIAKLSQKYPHYPVKIIDNPQQFMPMGFNRGLKNAQGEVIIMMGGHAELAPDYVTQCIKLLNEYPVACVGGAMETVALGQVSQAIAIAMSSSFGVGGVAFRTRPNQVMEVDTVVFAAYRRTVFEEIGFLDEEMIRNQDDEFSYRLRESGRKILFSPTIRSRYYSEIRPQSIMETIYSVRVLESPCLPKASLADAPPPVCAVGFRSGTDCIHDLICPKLELGSFYISPCSLFTGEFRCFPPFILSPWLA